MDVPYGSWQMSERLSGAIRRMMQTANGHRRRRGGDDRAQRIHVANRFAAERTRGSGIQAIAHTHSRRLSTSSRLRAAETTSSAKL
jgi:hypothetical protein